MSSTFNNIKCKNSSGGILIFSRAKDSNQTDTNSTSFETSRLRIVTLFVAWLNHVVTVRLQQAPASTQGQRCDDAYNTALIEINVK